MKKLVVAAIVFLAVGGFAASWYFVPGVRAGIESYLYGDEPDLPDFAKYKVNKEEFMLSRERNIAMLRGLDGDRPVDPQLRIQAIEQMDRQIAARGAANGSTEAGGATWTPVGPAPIPNAQVGTPPTTPASGRTTAIAVHPTNPDIVYSGTAMGGVYRSLDGGLNWTPLMDNAQSLAIGAIAIAPSNPEIVYVGTGEPTFSGTSFFGVGVYRIDNASTTANLTGPLNKDAANADVFTGRGIGEIVVHPTDPATIFVGTTSGIGGIVAVANNILPTRGIYRSTNATGAAPTFAKLTGLAGGGNFSIRDLAMDPLNPNLLVANVVAAGGVGGIYTTVNALAAAPTFTQTSVFTSGDTSELTAEFAIQHTDPAVPPVIYAATGNLGGRVLQSVDGGLTFTQRVDNNFCTPQCFYDIAIDVDPTNPNNVFLGGAPTLVFGRSIDGGATFTNNATTARGLHVDSHAITVSRSLPTRIYFGSDGGIYRSDDGGLNWIPLNNTQYFATQFIGMDVHPTDTIFTLGGTQDNGTNLRDPNLPPLPFNNWRRADFGDGGYAVIDQNSPDTVNVRMYHTYFNAVNLQGYATVSNTAQAQDGTWTRRGCGSTGATANGITCNGSILFYAPLERGPGNPNTIYYGSDRLYRSSDTGATHTVVSQNPVSGIAPISAIGIAPTDDNIRLVGTTNGTLVGTLNGSTPLVNFDAGNAIPNSPIARIRIAKTDPKIAFVTLSVFGANNVFRTTDLNNPAGPTWTPMVGAGTNRLPQVPVSSFLIDPINSNFVYAGTDIGVYMSPDGGGNWTPYGTGLPRIAVFGLEMAPGRIVRAATHGKGIYNAPAALPPTASGVTVSGRIANGSNGIPLAVVRVTDMQGNTRRTNADKSGFYRLEEVAAGQTYIFEIFAKNYQFASQTITINENLEDLNFAPTNTQRR